MSSIPAVTPTTLWMLQYFYVPDILEKRTPHRAEHLAGLNQAAADGTMVLGTSGSWWGWAKGKRGRQEGGWEEGPNDGHVIQTRERMEERAYAIYGNSTYCTALLVLPSFCFFFNPLTPSSLFLLLLPCCRRGPGRPGGHGHFGVYGQGRGRGLCGQGRLCQGGAGERVEGPAVDRGGGKQVVRTEGGRTGGREGGKGM